jgi:hypothetical protein
MQKVKGREERRLWVLAGGVRVMYTRPIPSSGSPENSVVGSMRKGGAMFKKAESRRGGGGNLVTESEVGKARGMEFGFN